MISKEILQNATLIDVREDLELALDGSIPEAKHIPMAEIEDNLEEFKSMPKPLVIFCRSGKRAENVKEYLYANGIEEVYNGLGYTDIINTLQE